jgi:hypothetical protein
MGRKGSKYDSTRTQTYQKTARKNPEQDFLIVPQVMGQVPYRDIAIMLNI